MEPIVITSTATLSNTLAYTLPTTGDVVVYHRYVSTGDILIAAPLWVLAILAVFVVIFLAAKGRL